TIGVNTDTSILSGTYSNTLLFTAAANPPYVGYTLKFNPNIDGAGGSGSGSDIASNMPATMTETVMATSYKFTVPDTIPTRPNYAFSSWNSKPDGTGATYHAGDKIEVVAEDLSDLSDVKAETTIYAIWTQYNYTVTYNCNSGSNCPSNQTIVTGDNPYTYTIPSTAPTRTDYNFTNYTGSDGNTYNPGDTISLSSSKTSVTLTANWEEACGYSGGCWTDSNGNIWTKTVVGSATWANAPAVCTALGGTWHLPTNTEFLKLIGEQYYYPTTLKTEPYQTLKAMWGVNSYWSATAISDQFADQLDIQGSQAFVGYRYKTYNYKIVCTK
ncbi:InlB B-repeat-containing protein, partial [Candidatus Saccharibacteria bacterium]|nr:InlB B-repeat-containing protein [Candidatus Saccharibacteria bacterium]